MRAIWELSRFAIETDCDSRFGLSQITMESFSEMVLYGRSHGIDRYVTVTTTSLRAPGAARRRRHHPARATGADRHRAGGGAVHRRRCHLPAVFEQRLAS